MSLAGVDQRTYGEFVDNLDTPACFHVLRAGPLDERLLLDIEPSILYPLIDRMLGGGREDEPPLGRPLTRDRTASGRPHGPPVPPRVPPGLGRTCSS